MTAPQRKVPLCIPDMGDEEVEAAAEVIRSGWLAHGPKNHEFEELFARYIGVPHAVSLNSCAAALHLAILTSGIKGDVILPSFTFVASANAVITGGMRCLFVDIDYDTCNIDPAAVEAAITSRTEAIMPVHYGGQLADMEALARIAEKHHLLLIEDSAEAIGATQNGKKSGQWGIGCFSFYPTKNITTGEGGMLTTRDGELAAKVRAHSGHGIASTTLAREKKEKPWLRAATHAGCNFRMSNLNAALGVVQMKKLDAMNERRQHAAARYDALLDRTFFDLPVTRPGFTHVWQMYTVKVKGVDRTRLLAKLKAQGIGASVHFDPPVHVQPYYAELGCAKLDLPVTVKVAERIVTLPIYPSMSDEDVAYVADAANEAAKACRTA